MAEVIPEQVKRFLVAYIDSIAEWEGLLLFKSNPNKEWDAKSLASALYISESEASELLIRLQKNQFINKAALYRYNLLSEHHAIITQAAELYRQYLVPMTHIIHSKSRTRIQQFANAFKIRKE